MIWFAYTAAFALLALWFWFVRDRTSLKFTLGAGGLWLVASVLIGATNYFQIGRVFI